MVGEGGSGRKVVCLLRDVWVLAGVRESRFFLVRGSQFPQHIPDRLWTCIYRRRKKDMSGWHPLLDMTSILSLTCQGHLPWCLTYCRRHVCLRRRCGWHFLFPALSGLLTVYYFALLCHLLNVDMADERRHSVSPPDFFQPPRHHPGAHLKMPVMCMKRSNHWMIVSGQTENIHPTRKTHFFVLGCLWHGLLFLVFARETAPVAILVCRRWREHARAWYDAQFLQVGYSKS